MANSRKEQEATSLAFCMITYKPLNTCKLACAERYGTMYKQDTRFFTNTDNDTLYERFVTTLKNTQYFDVLVGYFRASGYNRLYKELQAVQEIRILVGLNMDRQSVAQVQQAGFVRQNMPVSLNQTKEAYNKTLQAELDESEDTEDVETSTKKFIEFIRSGKLKIKVHKEGNLHAKVYITRYNEDCPDFGNVITGSSNFSENGLVAQHEFNVSLKDTPDVRFAFERFEELWANAVDVSDDCIETVQHSTWLNEQITPYQIYMKFLYEYFKEDINQEDGADFNLPEGFMELEYQKQAVTSAKKILDMYNGVFLSDVVGLGKTFITAMLMQKLPQGRKLVICPPCYDGLLARNVSSVLCTGV